MRSLTPTSWRPSLFPRLIEVFQIRRRLVLPGRHQPVVCADEIVLLADLDLAVVLRANRLDPDRVSFATVIPRDRPRTGQGMVDHRDFVMKNIAIGLVQVDSLFHDGLTIRVKGHATAVVTVGTFDVAGFDEERVVTA